ncbi:T9SS type A sorting domain-containing protein [Flavobacterium johnsoniae]|uniref:T9SS type A sorting domain-containing protein n=1 Tax=Flavobacterium johnsoniae TaxID=986 RepID=UPI0025B278DE|nr:T9SS type A sorting domain-containing protein [Flavobacterium johnsoniae]WJS93851.1 T9SS type A sorting domain-containing protein [Flavobacterium johnsoniae]
MYVKNEVLYVQQNIQLSTNSNLYLRNNAQLIQGGNTSSTNTGLGSLSVYQEGTSDNYDYNYWCSPIGIPTAATGNNNFGIAALGRPTTATATTPAIILPAGSYDGISNPLSIASSWIYKLINANNYSQWILVGGASTIAPGEGFTMKGTSGTDSVDPEGSGVTNNPGSAQRYDFRGRPNNGNITVALGANNATLTGNPYPSALHLNEFLLDTDNRTITGGTAYFWQQDRTIDSHYLSAYRGGYGSYAPINTTSNGVYIPPVFNAYKQDGTVNPGPGSGTGTVLPRRYAPIGQGFLLNGTANGIVTFKNAHRVFFKELLGGSQFEKPSKKSEANEETETLSYFRINAIINNQFTRQLALVFVPEATDGIDTGIDALNMTADLPDDVNFWIEDANYLIQGVNFDPSKKIPLAVKASANTTLKFSIPEFTNFDTTQKVYIYDKFDNSYHDIKNGNYEVTVTAGTYNDRFQVAFLDQTLGVEENSELGNFIIYQDNVSKNIKASNPNSLAIKSFTLYDITGKTVLSKKDLKTDSNYNFSTIGLSYGIYIAEFLTEDNQKLTKKVLISNSGK